jgi:type VI secretion system (T6SS) effector Hcp
MEEPRKDEPVEDLDVPTEDSEAVKGGSLKLGDIKGESTDSKHPDQIEILSYRRGQ